MSLAYLITEDDVVCIQSGVFSELQIDREFVANSDGGHQAVEFYGYGKSYEEFLSPAQEMALAVLQGDEETALVLADRVLEEFHAGRRTT